MVALIVFCFSSLDDSFSNTRTPFVEIMQAALHDPVTTKCCAPLTQYRSLGECLVGNRRIQSLIKDDLRAAGFEIVASEDATEDTLHLPVDHLVEAGALRVLAETEESACMRDGRGDLVAWKGADHPDKCIRTIVTEEICFRIEYPWDLLQLNENILTLMTENKSEGKISPLAQIDGFVHLGEGSVILPGVYIEGNVVIGKGCKIGPNAYIRGNTSIGDRCIIGNAVEIKNSVIYPHTSIKHLSYVGDSIIGAYVSLGAGTIIANHRHDGSNHHANIRGYRVNTQREKFGALLGDSVRTGVNTCVYPGRRIGAGKRTRPNTIVDTDLMPPDPADDRRQSEF